MAQMVKNPPADAEEAGSVPGSGRSSGGGNGNPLQYSCLEKSHGLKSLVAYSPEGCRELDMTEHTHIYAKATFREVRMPAYGSVGDLTVSPQKTLRGLTMGS